MTLSAKRGSLLAVGLIAALLCALLVLPGQAVTDTAQPVLSQAAASAAYPPAPAQAAAPSRPVAYLEAELLSNPTPLTQPETAPEEELPEPELTPVIAQYASEHIQSTRETTCIPDYLAACTAGVAVPDDLSLIDSFLATAYCVTGTTSTGTQTTVGRTLAVNPGIIPYGAEVWMFLDDGTYIGTFTAEDTGSNMMAHPYVVDLYLGADSYNDCILWGSQHVRLYTRATEN